jgi:hypothetical protein
MQKLILPLFALMGFAASAQFSIQPQLGMETSRTAIRLNDLSSFAPEGIQIAPRIGLRMEYKVKTGHGAFLGFATGNSAVQYSFSDPAAARTIYKTSTEGLQLRLEGGYQFTSKKISLGKAASSKKQTQTRPEHHFQSREFRGLGGGEFRGFGSGEFRRHGGGEKHHGGGQMRCGQRSSSNQKATASRMAKDDGLYMRVKPSAGIAFVPSATNGLITNIKGGQTTYEYNTGINTAVIAGTAFEFGRGNKPKFVVSVNYLKGLGNNTQTLTTGTIAKPVVNTFSSRTSGFIVSMGLPLNLSKKAAVTQKKQCSRQSYEGRCGRYKM